jgi:hemolysin activation/secretion protein
VALAARAWAAQPPATELEPEPKPVVTRTLDINEYRVEDATLLSELEVEVAVTPFLGPGRVLEDVERARVALEKAYSDRGFLAVRVAIPPQKVHEGVVALQVTEGTIGHLRVRGSRFFGLSEMRAIAPSLAEGTAPNLNDISRDIVALNQLPDRRVTPELKSGATPGTIDVDLKVQDTLPLHGMAEFNNRFSTGTTPTRLTGWLAYDNLWQQGHSLRFSLQLAPERLADARVFSLAYTVRLPSTPWLSLVLSGVDQDSDISTLGNIAVRGRGWIASARALITLPNFGSWYHTISTGLDFKRFIERIKLGEDELLALLTYWPLTAQYGGTFLAASAQTQLTATATMNLRGLGSTNEDFDRKRYKAPAGFVHFRLELSHTQRLPAGFELFARASGQYSGDPLIGAEQLIAGGAESVRGYLEGQAAGDFGGLVSLELRSPPLRPFAEAARRHPLDLRLHAFGEGGWMRLWEPLPEQNSVFRLWSAGGGVRLAIFQHLHGSLDVAVPLRAEGTTERFKPRFLFRVWVDL